ncbi:MAG: hypothetical protein KGY50_04130, partial [Candidatus Thermoplasmatota archaeon]|nr:hypothetical protein [Candidatus Thermoplasmatota archaeon]
EEPQDICCFHGHGQPHQIQLNSTSNLRLSSKLTSFLQTKILAIDGCYTDSIYTNPNDAPTPFISTLCRSNTMHLGFFGLLSQQTVNQTRNIINTILPRITTRSTIAEVINNASIEFDFVFTGDPTIHVTL